MTASFDLLIKEISACRLCREAPRYGVPLPHEPRPIIQASEAARICIASQAPGVRAHASGRPYSDPSGVRLRAWLGVDETIFYDSQKVAIIPMGCCFPGLDAKGGDLPPRRECAEIWRARIFAHLPRIELLLLVGQYAQKWHFPPATIAGGVTQTVTKWRDFYYPKARPRILPLPHPSWRNSGWLKRNPWFESDLLPVLRADVADLVKKT